MGQSRLAALASAVGSITLVACALAMTALSVRRQFAPPHARSTERFVAQPDWANYATEGRRIGGPTAKVVMVEFADFQCPACRELEVMLRATRRRLGADFALVYRHYPLRIHPQAEPAALASECAGRQGRFGEMHDLLFDQSDSLGKIGWRRLASDAGVSDLATFDRCMLDSEVVATVRRDADAARHLGATGTPTFLINGVRHTGTIAHGILDSLVDEAARVHKPRP